MGRITRFRRGTVALGICGLVCLGYAGYALANSVLVTITSSALQPGTVSVALGDTITFKNSDGVSHVVASKPLTWTSPVITAGGTATYIATKTGSWGYQVADSGGKNRVQGSIAVTSPGAVTLTASVSAIRYGRSIVLQGTTPLPAYPVVIEQQDGRSWDPLPNQVTAAADGTFSLTLTPRQQTAYRANVLNGAIVSATQTVTVQPVLTLRATPRRLATGKQVRFTAHVTPADAVKQVAIQEYDKAKKHWNRVGTSAPTAAGNVTVSVVARQGYTAYRASTQGVAKGYTTALSAHVVIVGVGAPPTHKKKQSKTTSKTTTTKTTTTTKKRTGKKKKH